MRLKLWKQFDEPVPIPPQVTFSGAGVSAIVFMRQHVGVGHHVPLWITDEVIVTPIVGVTSFVIWISTDVD